jgi:hypothetical protein
MHIKLTTINNHQNKANIYLLKQQNHKNLNINFIVEI